MPHPAFRFDDFELIPAARELRRAGERVALPPRAFRCLVMLVEQRDRVLGRDELIATLWPRGSATDVQLGQLILQCRRAVDDDGQAQRAIRTVPGFGYRWVSATTFDVEARATDGSAAVDAGSQAGASVRIETASPEHASDAVASDDAPPRPDGADELSMPADSTTVKVATTIPPRRSRRVIPIAIALLLVAAVAFVWHQPGTQPPAPDDAQPAPTAADATPSRLVVLPLETAPTDEAWIRLGGMDLIGDRLRRSGLAVLPSDTTVSLLHGLAAAATPPETLADALRDAAAADRIVDATLVRSDSGWQAQVVATAADGRRAVGRVDDPSPATALRIAADRLAAALGHVPAPTSDAGSVAETLQRARAAMLASGPEAARAILLADPALVRDQPRLRQQLAEVDLRAGRTQAGRDALDALLVETTGTATPFRAELLAARATVDVRSGDFAAAGQRASEALALLGTAEHDPILLGRLHLMRGVSRISLQDYAGALVDNGIARDAFTRAGDIGSVARVDANHGVLEILRGHPAQAEPYLERAIARFGELGIRQEPIGNLQMLYVARRQQLHYDGAMHAIDAAWAQRADIRNPDSQLSVRLYRAQGLLRTGRLTDAAVLLDDPTNERTPSDPADADRLAVLRADLAWRRGDAETALALLADVDESELASADSDTPRADLGVLRSRLERTLQRVPPTDASLAMPAPDDTRAHPRVPWRWLAAANRAAAAGDAVLADQRYQRALVLADGQGVAETISGIVGDYVAFLIEQDRIDEAAAIANRTAVWHEIDLDAALAQLRVAHARGDATRWRNLFATARRLAGEQALPTTLLEPPPGA